MAAKDTPSPKKRGSKLNRSETLTVRFDPITRYAVELAAAKERQTVSSFVEQAARLAAGRSHVAFDDEGQGISALELSERTWSPDPVNRTLELVLNAPHLLPTDQQLLGEAISFFMKEIGVMLEVAEFRHWQIKTPQGGTLLLPGHLVKAAFPDIEACVSPESIDRERLVELARTQLVTRGIIQID